MTKWRSPWVSKRITHEGQTYSLAIGLLYVNRQIHQEVSSIFYTENNFVLVQLKQDSFVERLLQQRAVAVASTCKTVNDARMAVVVDLVSRVDGTARLDPEHKFVIASQDFETFELVLYGLQLTRHFMICGTCIKCID